MIHGKSPVASFFIDGLSGVEHANLVKVCIKKLHDVGVNIVSLTCDGPACHFKLLKELGACLNITSLQAYFIHPLDKNKKIYVLLDVCHMLKLIRNTFGASGILVDKDGNKIYWRYIVQLQKLQDEEGLRLGNKLKLAHIQWEQQKMKVNLAAQVFSFKVQRQQSSLSACLINCLISSTPTTHVQMVSRHCFVSKIKDSGIHLLMMHLTTSRI